MNRSIFWRLVWKEYRLQRAFWIAMAVLTGLLLLLVFGVAFPKDRASWAFVVAIALPAFYALGCGATLFAGEQEAETYEFERALPASAGRVFAGKVVFALLSTAALFGLMWLLAFAASGWQLPSNHVTLWAALGFFGLEMFVWAVLFSLLSKRVLMAAILGVAAASVGAQLVTMHIAGASVMEMYAHAVLWRLALAAVVAMADVWLGARWLCERRHRGASSVRLVEDAPARGGVNAFSPQFRTPARTTILGRLLWQHWRQSIWMTATLVGLLVILTVIGAWVASCVFRSHKAWLDPLYYLAAILPVAAIPLLGVCTFLADQRGSSYRFLADRGVPPKYVWLSRQLITLVLPVFVFVALIPVALILGALLSRNLFRPEQNVLNAPAVLVFFVGYAALCFIGYVILSIAVGQLFSMLLRGGILAGVFSIVLTFILAVWCGLMWLWGVNWLWSVVPIPLALLMATRLCTRDWLLEQNSFRAWLRPASVLIVPAALLLVAVPFYRIYSVPEVDPGFSPEEFARSLTPQDQESLNPYGKLGYFGQPYLETKEEEEQKRKDPLRLTASENKWGERNQEAIAAALKASREKFVYPADDTAPSTWLCGLARLLVCSAAKLEEEGKLDAAFEQYLAALRVAGQVRDWYPLLPFEFSYLYDPSASRIPVEWEVYTRLPAWAARPGQTPERLNAAARQLEETTSDVPTSDEIKTAYLRARRFLDGHLGAVPSVVRGVKDEPVPPLTMLWLHLPWERARALRLLNLLTREELDAVSQAEQEARAGHMIWPPPRSPWANVHQWSLGFEFAYALCGQIQVPPISYNADWGKARMVRDYTAMVTLRRAACLIIALEAWKLEHGSLPEHLEELVGTCLDKLPIDPYSGKPFRYLRDGLKDRLQWSQPTLKDLLSRCRYVEHLAGGEIAANTPFIFIWAEDAELQRRSIARGSPVVGEETYPQASWEERSRAGRKPAGPSRSHDVVKE